MIKQLARDLIGLFKRWLYSYRLRQAPIRVIQNVPYFAQWESTDLIDQILDHKIDARDDPKWRDSGAKTKLDYLNWSWSGCGLACLKMVLKAKTGRDYQLISLGKMSLKYGCYKLAKKAYNQGDYEQALPGLYYEPFIKFIKDRFNLSGEIPRPLVLEEILWHISQGDYVITSIGGPLYGHQGGGHLVLPIGYDLEEQVIYIHNPSGRTANLQECAVWSLNDFKRTFSGKGILLRN